MFYVIFPPPHSQGLPRRDNDVDNTLRVPVKDIYLLPLTADFRRRLCA